MIANDLELHVTLDRIAAFQQFVIDLRQSATNAANYASSVAGYLAEIQKMQNEVKEYLCKLPAQLAAVA